jgi:hypothetical protein
VEVFYKDKLLVCGDFGQPLPLAELFSVIQRRGGQDPAGVHLFKGAMYVPFDSVRESGLFPGSYMLADPVNYYDETEQTLHMPEAEDEPTPIEPQVSVHESNAPVAAAAAAAAAPPVAVAVAASLASPSTAAVDPEPRVEVFYNRALFLRGAIGQPLPLAVLRAVIQGRGERRNPAAFHLIHRDTVTHIPFDSVAQSGLPNGAYTLYPPVNDDGEPEQLLNMAAEEDEPTAIPEPEMSAPVAAAATAAAAAAAGTPAVAVAGVKRKLSNAASASASEESAPSKQQRTPSSYRAHVRHHPRTSGDMGARRAWQQRYLPGSASSDTRQMWNNGGPVEYLVRRPT